MADYKDRINAEINKESSALKADLDRKIGIRNIFGDLKDKDIHSIRIKSDRIVIIERGEDDPTNRYAYYTRFLEDQDKRDLASLMEKELGLETEDFDKTNSKGSFLWNMALFMDAFFNREESGEGPFIKVSSRPMNPRDNGKDGFLKEELVDRICCKGTEIYEGYIVFNGSYKESDLISDLKLNI